MNLRYFPPEGGSAIQLDEMVKLWRLCVSYVHENEISSAEAVHQADRVGESALEFIEEITKITGFCPDYDRPRKRVKKRALD